MSKYGFLYLRHVPHRLLFSFFIFEKQGNGRTQRDVDRRQCSEMKSFFFLVGSVFSQTSEIQHNHRHMLRRQGLDAHIRRYPSALPRIARSRMLEWHTALCARLLVQSWRNQSVCSLRSDIYHRPLPVPGFRFHLPIGLPSEPLHISAPSRGFLLVW